MRLEIKACISVSVHSLVRYFLILLILYKLNNRMLQSLFSLCDHPWIG